ncbi:hypothetical protein EJ02DRAFT_457901 [Clathrospora elynae]|uniref:Uncharacterized protein n=1 Tax=Clathrospora elynae TaxID=706981 RepID=A0A6A5SM86_9PLEO|nr:hypothetical protein EJ02DRAFT_457901 [Clathrospora elynae]
MVEDPSIGHVAAEWASRAEWRRCLLRALFQDRRIERRISQNNARRMQMRMRLDGYPLSTNESLEIYVHAAAFSDLPNYSLDAINDYLNAPTTPNARTTTAGGTSTNPAAVAQGPNVSGPSRDQTSTTRFTPSAGQCPSGSTSTSSKRSSAKPSATTRWKSTSTRHKVTEHPEVEPVTDNEEDEQKASQVEPFWKGEFKKRRPEDDDKGMGGASAGMGC